MICLRCHYWSRWSLRPRDFRRKEAQAPSSLGFSAVPSLINSSIFLRSFVSPSSLVSDLARRYKVCSDLSSPEPFRTLRDRFPSGLTSKRSVILEELYANGFRPGGRWLEPTMGKCKTCKFSECWGSSRSRKSTSLDRRLAGEGLKCILQVSWRPLECMVRVSELHKFLKLQSARK